MLINGLPQPIEYAFPMEAGSFAGFSATYIEVAEFDALHDDGISFAKKLEAEGISVEVHEIKGTCHGFEVALKSSMVRDSLDRRVAWIRKLFS